MGFTPTFDTIHDNGRLTDQRVETPRISIAARGPREILRFGGLSMDPVTGATYFRGKAVPLSVEERELLGILLRRAGQIISPERIAALLRVQVDAVAERIESLRADLRSAGATCVPCTADGIGYILWRC